MKRVLILGGGFAAVAAVEEMLKVRHDDVEITLVSSSRDFVFYPALVPFVFDTFSADEIHFNLAEKLMERKVRFIQAEVLSADPNKRTVTVTGDDVEGQLHYDYLLITLGRRVATERVPGLFEHAHHILTPHAADRFKASLAGFEKGRIVAALSPDASLPVPVCEMALAIADRFEAKIKAGSVSVAAVFPETLDDAFVGTTLFRDLRGAFASRGVELIERFPVERVEPGSLVSESGAAEPFDLLTMVPPFRGHSPVQNLNAVSGRSGFVHVNDKMQVYGNPGIYAAGDIVSIPGPRFGYMAIRQGRVAAANITAELSGKEPAELYEHKIAWAIGEKYTGPVFFHYGFWDESLDDYDENAFFGMAKPMHDKYGPIKGFGASLNESAGGGA